ncbi:MAG: T9SS type A sorting domain-containing protein [Saprospiraceae bacterium]
MHDDLYTPGDPTPLTEDLTGVLGYTTGVEENDADFQASFPYLAMPWAGDGECSGQITTSTSDNPGQSLLGMSSGSIVMANFPNPFTNQTTIKYLVNQAGKVNIRIFDMNGKMITNLVDERKNPGEYQRVWNAENVPDGTYFAIALSEDGTVQSTVKMVKVK